MNHYKIQFVTLLYLKQIVPPAYFYSVGEYAIMELDYLEIGQNIQKYRRICGCGKRSAEIINVSDQHISHIETGRTKLSLATLVAISDALQIDCNTLLGKTLVSARRTALQQRLDQLTSELDSKRLGLVVEFTSMLADYELD